jgi:hypothetical protein
MFADLTINFRFGTTLAFSFIVDNAYEIFLMRFWQWLNFWVQWRANKHLISRISSSSKFTIYWQNTWHCVSPSLGNHFWQCNFFHMVKLRGFINWKNTNTLWMFKGFSIVDCPKHQVLASINLMFLCCFFCFLMFSLSTGFGGFVNFLLLSTSREHYMTQMK